MNTLNNPKVAATLSVLHERAAENQRSRMLAAQQIADAEERRKYHEKSSATAFMSVSPEEGVFLNFLAKVSNAKNVVEFGCSFGISTIYLAAAAKDNGGKVTTSEMKPAKWGPALEHIAQAGLEDKVTLLRGNALETLTEVSREIDFLFLDGAKHLYLPVFELLRPKLAPGAVIFADNADKPDTQAFVNYVLEKPELFNTVSLFDNRALISYINPS